MGIDYVSLYGPALAPRLESDERLLAISEAKRPHGLTPDLPPPPPPPLPLPPPGPESGSDPRAGAKLAAARAGELALDGVEAIDSFGHGGPTDWLIRLLFGRAATGAPGSNAAGYLRAVPTDARVLVAVTDRRLVVSRIGRSSDLRPFGAPRKPVAAAKVTPLWSARRTDVAGARRRWHRLHGARLRVTFRDGSWLELTGPLCMGRRRAGELRDALRA